MRQRINAVKSLVSRCGSFLISTHMRPDPDAVGSVLAADEILKTLGCKPVIVLEDPVPPRCMLLPGAEEIVRFGDNNAVDDFDAVLILDSGSLKRIGDVQHLLKTNAEIVNIDHHVSNEQYGSINIVDTDCAATGELLYYLCRAMGLPVTPTLAANLYVGILTDTGRFRFSNTTAETMRTAADLISAGASPCRLTEWMYYDIPAKDVLSMGAIYSTLALSGDETVSSMIVTGDQAVEDPDPVVDIALSIKGVEVAALFSEMSNGKVRVSLRSKRHVNVSEIATGLGGGGHERAAGFRMKGSLTEVRERVVPLLVEAVRNEKPDAPIEEC